MIAVVENDAQPYARPYERPYAYARDHSASGVRCIASCVAKCVALCVAFVAVMWAVVAALAGCTGRRGQWLPQLAVGSTGEHWWTLLAALVAMVALVTALVTTACIDLGDPGEEGYIARTGHTRRRNPSPVVILTPS